RIGRGLLECLGRRPPEHRQPILGTPEAGRHRRAPQCVRRAADPPRRHACDQARPAGPVPQGRGQLRDVQRVQSRKLRVLCADPEPRQLRSASAEHRTRLSAADAATGFPLDVLTAARRRGGSPVKRLVALCVIVSASLLVPPSATVYAQFQRDRSTMLPPDLMKAIATELSGARAFNNVVEIAGYEYDRQPAEYASTYRETLVAERLAKAFGFANVRVTRLPVGYRQWDGEDAELWVTAPEKQLVARYLDHPA